MMIVQHPGLEIFIVKTTSIQAVKCAHMHGSGTIDAAEKVCTVHMVLYDSHHLPGQHVLTCIHKLLAMHGACMHASMQTGCSLSQEAAPIVLCS